jgi:hypothetical protein
MSKCATCGCGNFVPNQFKKSNCSNCLHDHSHKPPAVGSTFSQPTKSSTTVPTQKKSSGSTSSPNLTRAASTSKPAGHSPSVSAKKSPTDKEEKHKKDKSNVLSTATTSIKDTFDSIGNKFTSIFSTEDKKKRNGSESVKKKKGEESEGTARPMVISGPTNAQHVSHLGFDAHGGLTARNLPPEWAKFFQHLDETMKKMGQRGLTKKEMIMLMKYGTFAGTPAPGPSNAATSSSPSLTSSGSFSNTTSPAVNKKPLPSPTTARPSVTQTQVAHSPPPPLPKKPHPPVSKPSASEYQLSTLQSEYKSVQSQLHTLQADHKSLLAQITQLQAQLRDTTAKLSGAENEAQSSRQRLEQEREERSKVEKRVRELELELVSRPSVPASGARVSQNIEALRGKFDQELKSVRAELDKEREQLNQTKRALSEESSKRARAEENERTVRGQLEQLRTSSSTSTTQLSEVKQRHDQELSAVRDQLSSAVQDKNSSEVRAKQLQDEVKALTLKLELASTNSTQTMQDTGRKFDQQVASMKESYGKEIDVLRAQLEQQRGEKSVLERQVTQLQSASQEHKTQLQHESSERQRVQKELSTVQSELEQLRVKGEQSATQLRAQSEKDQAQLNGLNDKNRSLAMQVEQLKAELVEAQQHNAQTTTASTQFEQERRAYETQLATLKQKLSTDMDQWAKRLESETRAKRALEDELSSAKKELSQSQSASKSLLQDSSARQELQQKYDQLGREYSRALDKIETLEDQVSMLKEQLEQVPEEVEAAAPPPPPPVPSLSPPPPPKAPSPHAAVSSSVERPSGGMSNLLDSIREGKQLKPVEANEMRIDPNNFKDEGVLSVLAKALIDRRANMLEEEGEDNTPIDWD